MQVPRAGTWWDLVGSLRRKHACHATLHTWFGLHAESSYGVRAMRICDLLDPGEEQGRQLLITLHGITSPGQAACSSAPYSVQARSDPHF